MAEASPASAERAVSTAARTIPHLRWLICLLLFVATTINYIDRQTVAVLNPVVLKKAIGWDEIGFGWIMFAFQMGYAIMFPISGRLMDRLGVRVGMMWAVVVWSL